MSRSVDAVQAEMLGQAPPGDAGYPRDPESNWGVILRVPAAEAARIEAQVEALLEEIDPRNAFNLLADWQGLFGADPYGVATTGFSTAQLKAYLYQRLTSRGGQSKGFFIGLAASLGVAISIEEFFPPVYGEAVYGDVYLNSPNEFMWLVILPETQAVDAVYGDAQYGDFYGTITPNPVVPVIQALAPAHTLPVFSYTG